MCGLVGVAGDLEYKDEAIIKRLLWFSSMARGDDSTGVGVIKKDGNMIVRKAVGPPYNLFDHTEFRSSFVATSSKAFIGHTRKATFGVISRMNAHPFEYGDVVGAHNGTLGRTCFSDLETKLDDKFTVDSQALISGIAKLGVKGTISAVDGAWSLVWYDNRDNTINFLRNDQRPLIIAWSENKKKLYWASEIWMLATACENIPGGQKLWKDKKGNTFFEHQPDLHYAYKIDDIINPPAKGIKPKVQKVEGKPAPAPVPFNRPSYQEVFMRRQKNDNGGIHRAPGTRTSMTSSLGYREGSTPIGVLTINPTLTTEPWGGIVTREQFDEIGSMGCSFCSKAVPYGEAGVQIFPEEYIVLCPACSRSNTTQIHVLEVTQEMTEIAKSVSLRQYM